MTSPHEDRSYPSGRGSPGSYPGGYRRTRRFFRRSAAAAAVASAFAAGVNFWPIAAEVSRYVNAGVEPTIAGEGWGWVNVFVLLVVCAMAALAGALAVLTVGWWVQMRISQRHVRLHDARTAAARDGGSGASWSYPPASPPTVPPTIMDRERLREPSRPAGMHGSGASRGESGARIRRSPADPLTAERGPRPRSGDEVAPAPLSVEAGEGSEYAPPPLEAGTPGSVPPSGERDRARVADHDPLSAARERRRRRRRRRVAQAAERAEPTAAPVRAARALP